MVALCPTVLFHGRDHGQKKIVEKMVSCFKDKGSKLNDIVVVIGPCISQNSYEVKSDFKAKFLAQSSINKKYFKKNLFF